MDIVTEIISIVLESYFGWDEHEIAVRKCVKIHFVERKLSKVNFRS